MTIFSSAGGNRLFFTFLAVFGVGVAACSSARSGETLGADDSGKKPPSKTEITLEALDGRTDTISFHVGAPLFLRLRINAGRACEPFNGRPFWFDDAGAQVGWGFAEISDSLLFPRNAKSCERVVMLTSEHSNRLAEGYYPITVALLLDEKSRLTSDTVVLHPIHATTASEDSYSQFLLEQLVENSDLLRDPATVRGIFAEHLPHSPESEVYRAVILWNGGDHAGAADAVKASMKMQQEREGKISAAAAATRAELERRFDADSKE